MLMEGEYEFLSNFYPCRIVDKDYPELIYSSVEAAYQANKTKSKAERSKFVSLLPGKAKRLGKKLVLRADWDSVKDSIMEYYLVQKFSSPELRARLKNVSEPIVEDNYWNDTYWGICNGVGLNKLGKLLEKVREAIISNKDFF